MNGRSRAALVLIEKLIVTAIFALCAAACAGIFADAFLAANSARDLNNALVVAKNGAERYKANICMQETADSLGGFIVDYSGDLVVYFDKNWQVSREEDAVYTMKLCLIYNAAPPLLSELSVEKINGVEIIAFLVAARR